MDWILNHLQLIIAAAGSVAWWLNQRKQIRAGRKVQLDEKAPSVDPDLAGRTRRIRDEILRKIEQRTGASTQAPATPARREPVLPPPIIREVAGRPDELPAQATAKMKAASLEARETAEMLKQQAALAQQLRQASELRASNMRRLQFENQISSGDQAAVTARSALGDDFQNPDALRRAFILREVLGPPVALR